MANIVDVKIKNELNILFEKDADKQAALQHMSSYILTQYNLNVTEEELVAVIIMLATTIDGEDLLTLAHTATDNVEYAEVVHRTKLGGK